MKNIQMIPIGKLIHHPENPRKDLGDLTELAESIRQNGVMQNLTVVEGRYRTKEEFLEDCKAEGVNKCDAEAIYDIENCKVCDGSYMVVIGNRRMEAAKIAGLEELPCVISDMDHRTQIATMLEENMQRADLTLYEQAQGFQMMMDIGFTTKEISEKTGFSETTVNRRLKMAELDKKTFRQAVGKQITMDDLDRLGQIEDVKKRNELLAKYGENNFEWMVVAAIKNQKADKVRPKAFKLLKDAKAKEIPEKDRYSTYGRYESKSGWRIELDKWDGRTNFIPETDGDLYYRENGRDIELYQKVKKQKAEQAKKTPEEIEKGKRIDLAWKTIERVQQTARELRKAFVQKMTVSPKNAMEMLQWALIAAGGMVMDYYKPEKTLRDMAGLENEWVIPNRVEAISKYIRELPQSKWPELIFLMFEGDGNVSGYAYGGKYEMPKWKASKHIDYCYEWLTQFGYQMSDEEIRMMSGTHECFQVRMEEAGA